MMFIAKATSVNGVAVWEGYYAEIKEGNEKVPVIIDLREGASHKIIPSTLKWFTGIQTGKAQAIYEGDKVEVWHDLDSTLGIVEWSTADAGWIVRDERGVAHDLIGDTRYFAK